MARRVLTTKRPLINNPAMNAYERHWLPPDIISYAVWLYHRFDLSYRDVEDFLAERGISGSYETIRLWCIKFSVRYARRLKRLIRSSGGEPRKIVTYKLRSYGVENRELMPDVIHNIARYANNRAEQSHESTRVRERGMRRIKSSNQAQRFLSIHTAVHNLFNLGRHIVGAEHHRNLRIGALNE